MTNYKVQITKTYVIDVVAENEAEAQKRAAYVLESKENTLMQHYHESESPDIVVFDVTNTDDAFNPE